MQTFQWQEFNNYAMMNLNNHPIIGQKKFHKMQEEKLQQELESNFKLLKLWEYENELIVEPIIQPFQTNNTLVYLQLHPTQ